MFKILVVDDENLIRYSLSATFRDPAFAVRTAASGREALDAIREEIFDVCILDLHLPDMSGIDILQVLRAAAAESVSAALLWAIMRQESAYDRQARSKAGAIGLLQLMPATASQLARRAVPEDSLRDAALNVRLGARYVRALLAEFGDARAVLASYNAGEEAVRRWSGAGTKIDDEWVERIPYRETRDYVKQVYAICRRYESLYGSAGR